MNSEFEDWDIHGSGEHTWSSILQSTTVKSPQRVLSKTNANMVYTKFFPLENLLHKALDDSNGYFSSHLAVNSSKIILKNFLIVSAHTSVGILTNTQARE